MNFLERAWYRKSPWLVLLWPVALVFQLLVTLRRQLLTPSTKDPARVPLIVVGNLSVGGTGKTPAVIGLVEYLKEQGYQPGVISRGYGGRGNYPLPVTDATPAREAGDEALLIAGRCGCPVVVDPDRPAALAKLLQQGGVNVVLSDDGLQHYRLRRDIEICVVDGQRLFGNGWCLPAGPLREPLSRLGEVDFILINGAGPESHPLLATGFTMQLTPKYLVNLATDEKRPFSGAPFNMGSRVQAVSAIGNPGRFHECLQTLPYQVENFVFPDHHPFSEEDFERAGIDDRQPIVMTEKDAVKCRDFSRTNMWYLSTDVVLPAAFLERLRKRLEGATKLE